MKDFRNLQVWHKAHQLTLDVYKATARFPKSEIFALVNQMRRCSSSIGSNIAEGCGRRGNAEFHRFLQIASGSASELDYQLLLAHDLHFISDPSYESLHDELLDVRRMLSALIVRVDQDRLTAKC